MQGRLCLHPPARGMDELEDLCRSLVEAGRALCARRAEDDAALTREAQELRVEAAERLRVPETEGGKAPAPTDVLRLNVGGDPSFATTRKTLTCLGHSRLAELFSGRWDSALPRDESGRIFLDFDPAQFRALLDWLGDVCRIGPSANLPDPEESLPPDLRWGFGALCSLLRLSPRGENGGASAGAGRPASLSSELEDLAIADTTIEDEHTMVIPEGSLLTPALGAHLNRMLGTPDVPKKLVLLHRASRDGFTAAAFHALCDGQVRTVTVAQSVGGYIFGGFSGLATWGNQGQWAPSEGAFLFRLAGPGVQVPSKHPLVHNPGHAIYCHGGHGPTFGAGHDLYIQNSASTTGTLTSNLGATYSQQAEGGGIVLTSLAESSSTTITEWEVFSVEQQPSVDGLLREALSVPGELPENRGLLEQVRSVLAVAQASGISQKRRRQEIAGKRAHLERDVEFMKKFIDTPGSEHQIVRLNVSGKAMATMRTTLTQCAGSLLASKFGPRWSVKDEDVVDGGVFFDVSPTLFGTVLQFLRLKRLCGDVGDSLDISAPPVHRNSICAFDRLLDYLSMREYVPIAILDSTLLSHEHYATLQAWLMAGTRDLKQARLLHRASRDGFTAAAFHSHCDGQPHTLTVAKSNGGFLFGGYSGSAAWTSQGQYTASEGAFLFRLAGPGVHQPTKHPLAQNPWNAVYSPGGYGPTFGGGHDLCIQNSTSSRVTVTSNLGHTYSQQAEGASVSLTTLAEANSFDVLEWEVFALVSTAVQVSVAAL